MRLPPREMGSLRGLGAAAWYRWPQARGTQASETPLRSSSCQLVWWQQDLCPTAKPVARCEGSASGRAASPSELVPREGPCKAALGAALLEKQIFKHTRCGGEGKVYALLTASAALRAAAGTEPGRGRCAVAPGGLSHGDGSMHPPAGVGAPKSLSNRLCPAAQTFLRRQPLLHSVPRLGRLYGTG